MLFVRTAVVVSISLMALALAPSGEARAEGAAPAEGAAATPAAVAADSVPRDLYWGQVQGLMLGVAVTHCQQPLAAWLEDDIEFRDKHVISIGGCVLYGISFATAMKRWRRGLWINVLGPVVGITSVTAGWILSETNVINATVRPDTYQIMGGILQMAALARSIQLLRAGPPRARPSKLSFDVGPAGMALRGRW